VAFGLYLVAEPGIVFGTATELLQNGEVEWLLVVIYWLREELILVQRCSYSRFCSWSGFWCVFFGLGRN
jgi:hypothetical protein